MARLSATLAALGAARDTTIGCFRVIADSADAERDARQLASSLAVEVDVVRVPIATGLGAAWNAACNDCSVEFIVLLVAGICALAPDWCERLVGYAQNPDCGVVSPALLLPDGSFHNAGILLDAELATVRAYLGRQKDDLLSGARQVLAQNLTVPGSEILTFRREVHTTIGGFDAQLSDADLLAADFCLRVERLGLRNVWTPYVEGVWGGRPISPWAKRNVDETRAFLDRWQTRVGCDPAYNPNFANAGRTFDLAFPPRHGHSMRTTEPSGNEMNKVEIRDHA
jgi:O-antigen biosynthesis protein